MTQTLRISQPVARLGAEQAFEILARARQLEAAGREVVHLELGEPDCPTPPHILEAGIRALRDGATRYGPAGGLPQLRQAIAESLMNRGVLARAEDVLVTSGAKPMLFYALAALVEPGDEVLVPDLGIPLYQSVVRFAAGHPVTYSVNLRRKGGIDLEEIRARVSCRTRVLVLNTPHNPTGAVLEISDLAALAELAQRHDLAVISDEIYSRLAFTGCPASIAALPGMADRTVVVDGFSKTYAMTGWRLGYGVMPAALARRVERCIINTTSCAPAFVQLAGLAALTGSQDCVQALRSELLQRRETITEGLGRFVGVRCDEPQGTFYAFPEISGLLRGIGMNAESFAEVLLEEFGLACLPGTAFGPGGEAHLRFSFATSEEKLRLGLDLLRDACPLEFRPRIAPGIPPAGELRPALESRPR